MIEIKNLLQRFDKLLLSEKLKQEAVSQAVAEVIGVEIPATKIKIEDDTVYLNLGPVYKNEIFMKQERILSRLQELLKNKAPGKII